MQVRTETTATVGATRYASDVDDRTFDYNLLSLVKIAREVELVADSPSDVTNVDA